MKIETFSRNGCHFVLMLDSDERVLSAGVFTSRADGEEAFNLLMTALIRAGVALPSVPFGLTAPMTREEFMQELDESDREAKEMCAQ